MSGGAFSLAALDRICDLEVTVACEVLTVVSPFWLHHCQLTGRATHGHTSRGRRALNLKAYMLLELP
jgi:hypothetical protein